MPSTFTPNLNLELQVTGENVDAWGGILNSNVITKLDQVLGSTVAIAVSNADITITTSQFQNLRFDVTGVKTADVNIILPDGRGGFFYVSNASTGAFKLNIKTANAGTNTIVLPVGGVWILTNGVTVALVEYPGDVLSIASAATTDLGTIRTRRPSVTGTATITSFGSTAVTSQPLYFVSFTGAAVLTHNAVSLILPGSRNITTAAGDFALALYLGGGNWQVLAYLPASGIPIFPNIVGGYRALKVLVASASTVTTTADAISLEDPNGYSFRALAVNVTADITVSGANGLDTGAEAASTWYNKWVIYNPTTQTLAALLSLSATAPTMPAGYTFKARVGAVRNDGSSNLLRTIQVGRRSQYIIGTNPTLPLVLASGIQGNVSTPVWVAIPWANFAPPTACALRTNIFSTGGNSCMAAPSNSYGAVNSNTNPPPIIYSAGAQASMNEMILESANIYYAGNVAQSTLFVYGWEDNL